jgi:SAM-dependent methyltransferase
MESSVYAYLDQLEDRHWWFSARRQILFPLIDKLMADQPDGLILDVGCGTGGTVAALTDKYDCLGIDASELAISLARDRHPTSRFECGVMPEVIEPYRSRASVYLLMDVLEHIQDDQKFLSDLVENMQPGSSLIITVPARQVLWSQHDISAHHFRRYEARELLALLKSQPVELRTLTFFNTRLYPLIWLARVAGRFFNRAADDYTAELRLPLAPVNRLLENVFSSERHRVLTALRDREIVARGRGVSLLAVLHSPA